MQPTTDWSKTVRVEVRGDDVVGHAGNVIPRMLADNLGLTSGLSAALSRPEVTHDRGAVLRDVALSIAGGAGNLAGTAVLRDQERLFGQVASVPTRWRSLNEIDHQGMARIAPVRHRVRERVWELIEARHGAIPPDDIASRRATPGYSRIRPEGNRRATMDIGECVRASRARNATTTDAVPPVHFVARRYGMWHD
jgi:hypothetical protein